MRRGPNCLATVVTKDVEPVLERLDSCLDIVNETLAIVTAAVAKVGSTFRLPDGREGGVNPDWVCILEHDICTFHVRSEVVVLRSDQIQSSTLGGICGTSYLAVQHDRDWVVTILLINQVIGGTSSIERVGVPIGLVSSFPKKKVRKRAVSLDLLSEGSQILVTPRRKETVRGHVARSSQ